MEIGLLQTQDKVTAEHMAHKLGVSVRTVYRDIEALCMVGIPVVAEPGQFGGFSLPHGYKATIHGLMNTDISPLALRQLGTVWRDLRLKNVDDAIIKILGNIPELHKNRLLRLRERILVDKVGWFTDEIPADSFFTIEMAVMDNQPLQVAYEDASGMIREYMIEPYGMVSKAGVWYLVAYNNEVFKTYRISRFLNVRITERKFERQPDFMLHQFWENSVRQYESLGEAVDVKLRVDSDFLRKLPQFLGEEARKSVRDAELNPRSEWHLIEWTFESVSTMTSKVLSMGPYVRITEPTWAVNLIHEIVEKTARLYQKGEETKVHDA